MEAVCLAAAQVRVPLRFSIIQIRARRLHLQMVVVETRLEMEAQERRENLRLV